MDSNDEIIFDSEGYIRIYKSGHAKRFYFNGFVPPSTDLATGVSSKDATVAPGLTARLYMPKIESDKKLPIFVHFHGGAFCMGSSFEPLAHNYITSLVARANVIAVPVNYRLAPENYLPAAYEDSYAAVDWVLSHKNGGPETWLTDRGDFAQVYTSGESAGGNIAHHMAMYAGDSLCGTMLIHPYFLSSKKDEAEEFNPELTEKLVQLWKIACPSTTGLDDPWINPLADDAPPLATLRCKRVLVLVGGADNLRDRGRAYYEKLKESQWKGEVKYWEAPGEGHGFFLFKPKSELTEAQNQIIADFVNKESSQQQQQIDQNDEIIFDIDNAIQIYKSGRVKRFLGTGFVPPSTDPTTGVSFKDITITPCVSARLYLPKLDSDRRVPILVYYHGGRFCLGSAFDSPWHNHIVSFVSQANVIAVSVQYRLAPQHPLPAAYEDSYVALDWVISHVNDVPGSWISDHGDLNRVFLLGESAGGNIVHHVAMYGGSKVHGAVLVHPYFLSSSLVESEKMDPVSTEKGKSVWKIVCPKTSGLDDPLINPFVNGAPPIAGLGCKRVLVTVAEMDVTRDRGWAYYEKLKESGWKGEAKFWEAVGEEHCFHLAKPESELALVQAQIIADFVNETG